MSSHEGPSPAVLASTTDALVRALRALGNAGRPEEASRIGAKAWWALKENHPREAERINGVMHFLARQEAAAATDRNTPAPAAADTPTAVPDKETA